MLQSRRFSGRRHRRNMQIYILSREKFALIIHIPRQARAHKHTHTHTRPPRSYRVVLLRIFEQRLFINICKSWKISGRCCWFSFISKSLRISWIARINIYALPLILKISYANRMYYYNNEFFSRNNVIALFCDTKKDYTLR